MKSLLLTLVTFWGCFAAQAGIIEWTNSIHTPYGGIPVEIGEPEAIDSVKAEIPLGAYSDVSVLNRISLGVDIHYPQYFGSAMDVSVRLNVKRWDVSMTALPDTSIWLNVLYVPSDTLRMTVLSKTEFSNAYKLVFSIEEIKINGSNETILPAHLFVQGDIFIERYRELGSGAFSTPFTKTDRDCNGTDDAITISWNPVTGAEEYQVEWAYINDYAENLPGWLPESALSYDFKFNSTRITTSETSHTLSLVFDRGWLVYRVRAVGILLSDPSHFVFGPWNVTERGQVSGITSNKVHITGMEQHEATVNWQYSVTYAEQGKQKEVVSYFDGTLRNRQTVTRVNSDNNIVVGETIYDHQGRPVVTVLPVPVADTVCTNDPESGQNLRLYRDFNVNDDNVAYSAEDFDKSDAGALCEVGAAPMSSTAGAANYYSSSNPDQNLHQGYVPDAAGYPFMQVEYTPDNTGRIRRQGGVGPEFQIGSGHESRYLYGQPNQVELDRLFGSEVGYQSHYQKNAVIDAHGQASISYLDQQGRVIATALAGDSPDNLTGIQSSFQEAVSIEVDALGSGGNTIGMDNRSLVFSTQLLVPYQSAHAFSYDFEITPVDIDCLDDICVDCVYDLTIDLIDECGINLAPASLQNKMVGKFTANESGYSFHAACVSPVNGELETTFTVSLAPGTYSLNKKLTVNQQALDSLIAIYLRSSCALTFDDFHDMTRSIIDSSGCEVSCEDCFDRLGTLENFITQGYGNSNDYYLRIEECQQLCQQDVSSCEIMETILRMDMTPSGQYGEYLDPVTELLSVGSFPLSIYNPSNLLPSGSASWRNPVLMTVQGQQQMYVNSNGERSKIYLSANPSGTLLPEPLNPAMIQTDPSTGQQFIYPEQLMDVADFIDLFEQSWARSLVTYHPEYCYYETCLLYEQPVTVGDVFTSYSFDQLLQNTATVQAAVDNKLVSFNTSTYDVLNWAAPAGNNPLMNTTAWDPFLYYPAAFNTASCADNYGTQLLNAFTHYKYIDGAWRSMSQVAAFTARCGTNFSSSYPTGCYNFGHQVMGVWDTDVLDQEWTIFKSFYLSEKQRIQRELADCRAVRECDSYNGCIGNADYTPLPQMQPYFAGTALQFPYAQMAQPCGVFKQHLYRNKTRRFADETVLPAQDANAVAYEVYLQTGQCPVEFTIQSLFSEMAKDGTLTAPSVIVNDYPHLSGLLQAMNNFNIPGTIPVLEHQASVSGNVLTAEWIAIPSSPVTTVTFTLSGSSAWNDVKDIINLYITGINSFMAEAVFHDIVNGTVYTETITGTITMELPTSCEFAQECSSNELAKRLTTLINVLHLDGNFTATSPVSINPYVSPAYGTYPELTDLYIQNAANVGSNLYWVSLSDNLYKVYDPSGAPSDGLYIHFNGTVPPGFFSTVSHLGNITSMGGSSFKVEVFFTAGGSMTASGVIYRETSGERLGVKSGDCGLPTPSACQTPAHDNFETLQALLNDVLVVQDYNGTNSIDLYTSLEINQTFINSLPWGASSSTSRLSANGDTLIISAGSCDLVLLAEAPAQLPQLTLITDFRVTGSPDNYGNFHDFEFVGYFDTGSGIITRTVYGTSCVSIKECNPCITPPQFEDDEQDTLPLLSALPVSLEEATWEDLRVYDANLAAIKDYDSLKSYLNTTYLMNDLPGHSGFQMTTCNSMYNLYLTCVNAYNDSVLANPGLGLFTVFPIIPLSAFMENNLCAEDDECAGYLCLRLYEVLTGIVVVSSQNALMEYINFNNFCNVKPMEPVDPCEAPYEQYLDCIASYNSSIDPGGYPVTQILTREQFAGMCNCVDDYCSRLSDILHGLVTINSVHDFQKYTNMEHCGRLPKPCQPAPVSGLPGIMPEEEISNNCAEMLRNQAFFEAQILYQNYVDSVSNALIQEYLDHCLGAVTETLNYQYTDKLYHYTLYYYDQAGNLIKTIPPEGVEQLDVTSSYSVRSQQIAADRAQNTKTVFTNHRLATRYEYNSLNQLVYQSTPDTDPMDIFELTLPNGLHNELITHKIQMVNEHVGYLGGEMNGTGVMYRTSDGGTTWQKMDNLVGATVRKAVLYHGNDGLAIGEKGTLLYTADGGSTWTLYPEAWQVAGSGVIHDLNDIAFINNGSAYECIIVGEDRTVLKLTASPGGTSIDVWDNGIAESLTASVSSVTTDGTDFFITVNDPATNRSTIYRLSSGASTWVAENSFTAGGLKDIHLYNATGAYAAGEDGRIYKKTAAASTSERWTLVKSDLINQVHAIRFFNEQNGVALVELQAGSNYLMRTFNGGANWVQISDNTFNHLSVSNNRSHVLAVGNNGIIEVVPPGNTVETIPVESGTTAHLTAGWIDNQLSANGLSSPQLIVATTSGQLRYTVNGFTNYPQWTASDHSALTAGDNVVNIEASRLAQAVFGAVLTESGHLYRLRKVAGSTTIDLFPYTGAGSGHKGLTATGSHIFSIDKTSDHLVSVSTTASNYTVIGSLNVDVSAIAGVTNKIIGVGETGGMLNVELDGTYGSIVTQTDESLQTNPNKLYAITSGAGTVVCAGEDGTIYQRVTSPVAHWKRLNTRINETIYSASIIAGPGILVAGEKGLLVGGGISGTSDFAWQPALLSGGATVQSQLGNTSLYATYSDGQNLYAVGENGKVVYSSNAIGQNFSIVTTAGGHDLFGVSPVTTWSVLIAGADAHIETRMGTVASVKNTLQVPPVRDLHFLNASTGTYLADGFVVRTTTTAGNTWKVVYPDTPQAPTTTYRKVWTKSASESYIFGVNAQYRSVASGLASPVSISGYAVNNVKNLAGRPGTDEVYLMNNGTVAKLDLSTHTAASLATVGADANALHVFRNGSYLVVGENGLYQHYSAANTLLQSNPSELAGYHFNDLAFTDNITGTLVGDNGAYFTTINPLIDASGYLTEVDWKQKTVTGTADPLGAVSMDIYTIGFASPTSGAFGGTYTSGGPFTHACVRKVFDAHSRYSNRFFYDRLGRLVVSQNARQYNGSDRKFSYTLYDALGRVVEAGEKTENGGAHPRFSSVFGTEVSNLFNPSVIDDAQLQAWIMAPGARKEVTRSYYDSTAIEGLSAEFNTDHSTQNKRIVHVTYEETYDGDDQTFDHATHYRYDIHGNVKTLMQDNKKMADDFPSIASQRFKRMDYAYDLVSGNVHRMSVQNGHSDQWHHAFVYDADNRITHVYTNTATPFVNIRGLAQDMENELNTNGDWQNDARYFYYAHGPLARVEIGQNNLQGLDYYYNLQGWLKGVNSAVLDNSRDPGKDSNPASVHALFAKDVFGFGLHYYAGDYVAVNGAGQQAQAGVHTTSHAAGNSAGLYNGNIRYMQTAITHPQTRAKMPMLNAYKYDQLNRLLESRSYENGLSANVWNPTAYGNEYFNAFTYDANGNILTQKRHTRNGTAIEDLTYRYHFNNGKLLRNRLYHVNDAVGDGIDDTDIDDMGHFYTSVDSINVYNNYVYDEEGRLIQDRQEEIDAIIWRVDGKVKEIRRPSGSLKKSIIFDYDAMGNRIAKHVLNSQTEMLETSTYYILDAQGQQLSMYEHTVDASSGVNYYLTERNIYGSSRIGVTKDTVNVYHPQLLPSYGVLGNRSYELNNHLGNVLTVIGDQVFAMPPVDTVYFNDFEENIDGFSVHPNVSTEWESGRMKVTTVEKWEKVTLNYTTEPGQLYRFKFIADLAGQGVISAVCYDRPNQLFTSYQTVHSNGSYYFDILAVSDRTEISFESGVDGNRIFYIDDVVLEKRTAIYANDLINSRGAMEAYGSNVTLSTENKSLKVSTSGSSNGVKEVFSTIPGKDYRLNFTIDPSNGGSIAASVKDFATSTVLQSYSTDYYNRAYMDFTAVGSETAFFVESTVSGTRDFYLNVLFVQETNPVTVPGYEVLVLNSFDYSPFGVQLNERTADGCTYETVLEPESERVIYQNMVYAGNDIAYVNSEGDLVGYQGTNGAGSSVQKVYPEEFITWNGSPVAENDTYVGLSYEDVSVGFGTIDYSWYLYYNGYAYISEKGVPITGITAPYSSGSEFKISREGGNIVYSVDGVVYRTVPDLYPDSSMVADATLYGIPGVDVTVRNLMINRMTEVQYADCGEASGINRKYRYGFNGMEKDDEAKGKGNSYDFGARMYDPRLGRWLSIDALASKYPGQSPYAFCNNNPLLYKDPNGESGIITITPGQNGNLGTITISMNVTLYGDGADPAVAQLAADELNKLVNEANLKYLINGEEYIVQLDLKIEVGTELVAYTGAQGSTIKTGKNTNYAKNFVRVEEVNQSQKAKGDADGFVALAYGHRQGYVSEWSGGIGGNTGFLIKDDFEKDVTSLLHELFHGLFSTHEAMKSMANTMSLPAVSLPTNSPASVFSNIPSTYLTTNNKGEKVIDAKKRMLTTYDLNVVFKALGYEVNADGNGVNMKLNNSGSTVINVGKLDNNYYDKSGNVDNDRNSRRSND